MVSNRASARPDPQQAALTGTSLRVNSSQIEKNQPNFAGATSPTTALRILNPNTSQPKRTRLLANTKDLKKRAEATVLYHSKHIIKLLDQIWREFEVLAQEEKMTEDKDVKARIDNERMELQDLVEKMLEKMEDVANKVMRK